MEDLIQICTILDKLTIDTLTLMEEYIQKKLDLETAMREGEINLAKARYILGHNNVSSLQLPTEDSPEMNPVAIINSEIDTELGYKTYDLEILRQGKIKEGDNKLQDPIKWFGVLVPQNLHLAQTKFRQTLVWAVQAANIQAQLDYNCTKIQQLRTLKQKLMKVDE